MKKRLKLLAEKMFHEKTNQYFFVIKNHRELKSAAIKCISEMNEGISKNENTLYSQSLKVKSFFALILSESIEK